MEVDQHIHRCGVERLRRRAAVERARVGRVAQILEQQQARFGVRSADAGSAVAARGEVAGDRAERPHVLGWRGVHQDGALAAALEALVSAEGSVAGKRLS